MTQPRTTALSNYGVNDTNLDFKLYGAANRPKER